VLALLLGFSTGDDNPGLMGRAAGGRRVARFPGEPRGRVRLSAPFVSRTARNIAAGQEVALSVPPMPSGSIRRLADGSTGALFAPQ
jgi:hypothetical protein